MIENKIVGGNIFDFLSPKSSFEDGNSVKTMFSLVFVNNSPKVKSRNV